MFGSIQLCTRKPLARSPQEAYYFYYGGQLQAIRIGKWKMHFPHEYRTLNGRLGGTGGTPTKYDQEKIGYALFNLEKDIRETWDVKDHHPKIVAKRMNPPKATHVMTLPFALLIASLGWHALSDVAERYSELGACYGFELRFLPHEVERTVDMLETPARLEHQSSRAGFYLIEPAERWFSGLCGAVIVAVDHVPAVRLLLMLPHAVDV